MRDSKVVTVASQRSAAMSPVPSEHHATCLCSCRLLLACGGIWAVPYRTSDRAIVIHNAHGRNITRERNCFLKSNHLHHSLCVPLTHLVYYRLPGFVRCGTTLFTGSLSAPPAVGSQLAPSRMPSRRSMARATTSRRPSATQLRGTSAQDGRGS